ncbi:unnamed protein product, partial [Polarella glacialis]
MEPMISHSSSFSFSEVNEEAQEAAVVQTLVFCDSAGKFGGICLWQSVVISIFEKLQLATSAARIYIDQAAIRMVDKWSMLTWSLADVGIGAGEERVGSAALAFVSCQGQDPVSIQPLRRFAELIHRHMEWWLFKSVWAFSTAVLALLVGVVASFTVRSALFGLYQVTARKSSKGGRNVLEVLEALVLVASPAGLATALCRLSGDLSMDMSALFLCLTIGE